MSPAALGIMASGVKAAVAGGVITLRGSATKLTPIGSSNAATVVVPAATQAGDLIIITGSVNSGGRAPALPAGYTLVHDIPTTTGFDLVWGWKIAVAGDAGANATVTTNLTGYDVVVTCLVFAGVDTTAPFGSALYAYNQSTTSPHVFPTVASVPANARELLLFAHSDYNTGSITLGAAPTGTTLIVNDLKQGGNAQSSAWSDATVSGTIGGRSWTFTAGTAPPGSAHTIALLPATPPPTLVSYTTTGSAAATFPVSVPAGVVDGDWLFTFIAAQSATITADFTIPSGWARVAWPFVASEGSMRFNAVYAHKVGATAEPASYTWGNAVVSRQIATCIAVRYANATTPVTAYNGPTTETLTTAPQIPVVTVPSNNSLVIGMAHNTNAAGTDGTQTFGAPWSVIAITSQPTPIAGAANDVLWLGQQTANAGSAGGQIGTIATGTPATDAGGIIVIGK